MFTEQDLELAKACVDDYFAQVNKIGPHEPLANVIAKYLAHVREHCHVGDSPQVSDGMPRKIA